MKTKDILLKAALPIIIIGLGFGIMKKMEAGRILPQKTIRKDKGALVEIYQVKSQNKQIEIIATGTVMAREEVVITPQVSGLVTKLHPQFQNGGFFKKEDILFEIEDTDYKLGLENAKAKLANAEFELATIKGKAKVALMEWKRMEHNNNQQPGDLLLYKPQLLNAKAGYASAKANLEQAELNLNRTKIRAPFNCFVRSEKVDVGQFVKSGNGVATISGTDAVEIITSVRMEDIQWLEIPRNGDNLSGSNVKVSINVADREIIWPGKIVRKLGEVDPKGRMARVIIAVNDPFNLAAKEPSTYNLSLGLFVKVTIAGRTLANAIVIPQSIVRDKKTVWLMDEENRLRIQKVEILRQDSLETLIKTGLQPGDQVVKTNLTGAVDSMKLRPVSLEASK